MLLAFWWWQGTHKFWYLPTYSSKEAYKAPPRQLFPHFVIAEKITGAPGSRDCALLHYVPKWQVQFIKISIFIVERWLNFHLGQWLKIYTDQIFYRRNKLPTYFYRQGSLQNISHDPLLHLEYRAPPKPQ